MGTWAGFAALAGAAAMLSFAIAPGSAATAQNTATHHQHIAMAAHAPQQGQTQVKTSQVKTTQPAANARNRITIVSVGPQAMAVQRIRDLAMEETG